METVLNQLNKVPGVVGSLVCDSEGTVLAQAFPGLFDAVMLKEAAAALADTRGLESMTGTIGMLDFRYADARVVVKPLERATLLVLCAKTINPQLLLLSASVAIKKLGKQIEAGGRATAPTGAPELTEPAPAAREAKWWNWFDPHS
jgi:predicted regulator of Ras-like GTPase activity (Roadblock/LC7/MglB family)